MEKPPDASEIHRESPAAACRTPRPTHTSGSMQALNNLHNKHTSLSPIVHIDASPLSDGVTCAPLLSHSCFLGTVRDAHARRRHLTKPRSLARELSVRARSSGGLVVCHTAGDIFSGRGLRCKRGNTATTTKPPRTRTCSCRLRLTCSWLLSRSALPTLSVP